MMVTSGQSINQVVLTVEVKQIESGGAFIRPNWSLDDVVDAEGRCEKQNGRQDGDKRELGALACGQTIHSARIMHQGHDER